MELSEYELTCRIMARQYKRQHPRMHAATCELWAAIAAEFELQKPPMTVRQMFYRMSAQGMVDKTEAGYRQVQRALKEMRGCGEVPYGHVADNTRWMRRPTTYDSLTDALANMQRFYRRSMWNEQLTHVEIWIEKDALASVFYDVTSRYDVPLYVQRGYASLSFVYDAAEYLQSVNKPITIYQFGDYDASGVDAARDLHDKLRGFGIEFNFMRVAVNEHQISLYNLQTRPSKTSDPRAARHGDYAVELDAIPPAQLRQMCEQVILNHVDPRIVEKVAQIERQERAVLNDWIGRLTG